MPRDFQMHPDPVWPDPPVRARRPERKVFEDPTGRRKTVVSLAFGLFVVLVVAWLAEFAWRVYSLPPAAQVEAAALIGRDAGPVRMPPAPSWPLAASGCDGAARAAAAPRVFAYLPAGDERARAGFHAHCAGIDALLIDGLGIDTAGKASRMPAGPVAATRAEWLGTGDLPPSYEIARPAPALTTPQLQALLLGLPGARRIAGDLVAAAAASDAAGVCLSLVDHPGIFVGSLRRLMSEWTELAEAAGQETCLIGGAGAGFWSDEASIAGVDRAVVIGFDMTGQPYAPAPRAFVDEAVAPAIRALPADKLVLAPGGFGMLWRSGTREPAMISYADSMLWADRHGAGVEFAAEIGNSRIGFLDDQRRRNQIWLLDAVSFRDQLTLLPESGAVAVWPLGYEDPGVWDLLAGPAAKAAVPAPVTLDRDLAALGEGPFVVAADPARPGRREVSATGEDARASAARYDQLPLPAQITRAGAGRVGEVSITFNGLPSEANLPFLLDALGGAGIRATFFATADAYARHSDAVRALLAAGHGFGGQVLPLNRDWPASDLARRLGLNRIQLQLSDEAGRRSVFLRDPSGRLTHPVAPRDFDGLGVLLAEGYVPVDAGITVPGDGTARAARLEGVRRAVLDRGANLLSIDLSDGGADARGWLAGLIADLSGDGFAFVGLDELARSDVALAALPSNLMPVARDVVTVSVLDFFTTKLAFVFFVMLALDCARALVYLTLAFQRRRHAEIDPDFLPGVTVLVPAFNEEDVIDRCLESITRSDYPRLRIIVIDDGSTDRTVELVRRNWRHDPRITLISQANQGKCHAANHALEHVNTPIFVGVDADTIVSPDAISWLVQQFQDPKVGAVSGFVEVGNRCNFLTRAQAVEYIVSQAVGRRAFDMLNGILVVPGAIGAWRTSAVRDAGLYSGNTITEDADLTIAIHRAGYKVRFEEHAHAFTEAPETIAPLVKQRIRWSLGMLQTSWKHRGAIREGRAVGLISIVDAVWISFLCMVLAPLVDLILVLLTVKAGYVLATQGAAAITLSSIIAVIALFSLIIVDTANAAAAFKLEGRRDYRLVALVPLLRFGYRQIMVFSALSALVRAATGRLYGWNKLTRTGTVAVPEPVLMPAE